MIVGRYKVGLGAGIEYPYQVRRSKRAKRPSISMRPNGELTVTIPWFRTKAAATRLVNEKIVWIERRVVEALSAHRISFIPHSDREKREYVEKARKLILERVEYFNQYYGFSYNRLAIKNTSSQWGSCSSKRNLNFNYRLYFLPIQLLDYIVVHELCHLKEMNHSKNFWSLVGQTIPDYKNRRKWLERYVID